MLLELLAAEDANRSAFLDVCRLIDTLLSTRKMQMSRPRLNFSVFDPLRNRAPRQMRLAKFEQEQKRNELAQKSPADFLAPYLVRHPTSRPTPTESLAILNACLGDMREDSMRTLNELQRCYDEHVSEALHFKRFLKKFHDQFDDCDYERLIKEGELIELNKRMIQQRLMAARETSQTKYVQLKRLLLADERLDLSAHKLDLSARND